MTLRLDPAEVASAADGWDDQHLCLLGGSRRLRDTSCAGFTAPTRGPAERFRAAWAALARELAVDAEARADSMRAAAVRIIEADDMSVAVAQLLEAELEETR
ncbi:hypothetical protein AB3X52_11635 [Nocardioides sp. DS6]|uniref:Uncharacterized protein n=1 Tax=Nocardioides eburneus TaxID=3231482 RepID=A0ABV3SZ97_9ACTN